MKVHSIEIEGLKIIELDVWKDNRGFFTERFQKNRFQAAGLPIDFPQDNHSRSFPKVLRGLHFQRDPAQGKLVGVVRGKIWDVAVDIRENSTTFGKHFGMEISGESGLMLWIPGGFAHGFCVLGEEPAEVSYKVDCLYNPKTDGGILWSDDELKIPWPIPNPIMSDRDRALPTFREWKIRWDTKG